MRKAHQWGFVAVTLLSVAMAQWSVAEENASPKLQKVTVRDGVELHYVELGKGEPVVFIHGGLTDYSMWNDHLGAFAKDYRAIAYSRRYNYPNENRIRPGHSAVVEAEDIALFIRKLELDRVHVVGYSYGAYTGLLLGIRHPELVRTLTLAEPPVMCWLEDLPDDRRKQGKALRADAMERCWKPVKMAFTKNNAVGALRIFVDYIRGNGTYDSLRLAARKRGLLNAREFEAIVMSGEMCE
jgi:pimeloyl-ACP methyl ester carboxylesterase